MPITILPVTTRRDLDRFIRFNYRLYKGHPYAVPELYRDLVALFTPGKNPALSFCDCQPFLAIRDGEVVGRIVGIVNRRANETWHTHNVRFGWPDFIDDTAVSTALLDTVAAWGRERGMTALQGPLGFTDMDREGMLVEGFDRIGTMSTYYNYPYYPQHMECYGLVKETDWLERIAYTPDGVPEKFARIAQIAAKRSNLHVRKLHSMREIRRERLGEKIFALINEAYTPIFGFSRLDDAQIKQLVNDYLPMIDLRMQTLVMNERDELVGVGLSMPSIVHALQKSGGTLTGLGWWHLLRSLKFKHEECVELLLVAVRPDYHGKGVNALLFNDLIPIYQKMGFRWAETNPELEDNHLAGSQWDYLRHEIVKRRRCYVKPL